MFRSRQKRSAIYHLRNFFWPRSGWTRSTTYLAHRIGRLPGTPYTISAGLAFGAAVSFTPFVGLHFVLAAIIAWIFRASIIASAIGTAVGNPWTFPFIWPGIFFLGKMLGAGGGVDLPDSTAFAMLFGNIIEALLAFDLAFLSDVAWPVIFPMLVGGVPAAVVVWFAFYLPGRPLIERYQRRRALRRRRKIEAEAMSKGPET
jgi:hypothetical protein